MFFYNQVNSAFTTLNTQTIFFFCCDYVLVRTSVIFLELKFSVVFSLSTTVRL